MTEPEPPMEAPALAPSVAPPEPPREALPPPVDPAYRIIAGLVLLMMVVLALVGTAPFWAPGIVAALPWGSGPAAADQDSTAIHALTARLDHDEATLQDQASHLGQFAADPAAIAALTTRVAKLEARPTPVPAPAPAVTQPAPAPAPPAADTAALNALKAELAKLEAASAATGDKLARLEAAIGAIGARDQAERARLLALANLRTAVEGSGPYAAELSAVEALAADKAKAQQALMPLAAYAKTGLPSLADLSERFDREVAPAILRARSVPTSRDFGQQILARLERLVVIRRVGGPLPADPVEAAVVRAEEALKAGDLAGATAALAHLPTASAAAAAPWLADAKRRVAAEAALDQLWQAETARAAAAAPPPGSKP